MAKEILVCKHCSGLGYRTLCELEDYHKSIYKEWNVECSECKGSGRVVKHTQVSYEPFIPSKL